MLDVSSSVMQDLRTAYERDGYVVVPGVLSPADVTLLQEVTDRFVERSRTMTQSEGGLELAPGHTASDPHLRRINTPHLLDPVYAQFVRDPRILAVVRALIGPDVRFHHSKLTVKPAGHGEAVEWHQDWAFYPHTNDDMLEVGICIDEATSENGPLSVLPGSHRGKIFDHHVDGVFCGAVAATEIGPELSRMVAMTAPAGSLTLHHVRMLHGAGPNRSDRPRRMLLVGYSAADAWPLSSFAPLPGAYFRDDIVCGEAAPVARMEKLPVRLPLPLPPTQSLYDIQNAHPDRVYAESS